ncbi:DUF6629 family protein [Streptomyces sp. MZ04]|uniref:DUF6629 family protein n=1 Tax=Streptomyces sp. MZ04 TaxID=2559236 RepID=UPI00107E6724|nr:DUF6629 family protein [Streptomyces sp. MZ04]TGB09143.1 hypothetical protein E2651_16995 [Streptomyces sp. MZ04]
MCWSATADLVAGTAVSTVGVVCLVQAARRPRDLPVAALPLLLGIHQIIESVVWRGDGGTGAATTAWAVIALPLLALWVPVAVLCAAPQNAHRRLLVPLAAGVATSAALAYCLATRTVTAEIHGHAVGYAFGLTYPEPVVAGYLVATIGSLLLSGDRGLVLFGVLVAVGAAVSVALWRREYISTWCALAAVCSVVLLGWVRRRRPAARRPSGRGLRGA